MSAILVIDDEKQVLDLIKIALTLHGYEVDVATDGYEGISKFDRSRYDVVITDICMPGLDGVGVVHHIRGSEKEATPVMAISGTPWNIEDADFDVILEKPFSIKSLVEHVAVLGEKEELPTRKLRILT
ncbi:MAG: response regulator [Desulfobacterales bacterium]|nr:response regulator [Desulfobacterales bacterium]